jgi:hypothetical protein
MRSVRRRARTSAARAHPDIRTLFALITPSDIDASWVESVVPHELTHVVFQTAVDNPYHDPPHWLNEGLAVYQSDGYRIPTVDRSKAAAKDGSLIPLDGLAGRFPTSRDRFFLAYAESVAAVDHIVRTEGRDALVSLIRSYRDGVSDDEAFRTALGQDVAGFEAGWLEELHAARPERLGPRAAPAGPLPEGWTGPQPNPSFDVLGPEPPQAPGAPRPHGHRRRPRRPRPRSDGRSPRSRPARADRLPRLPPDRAARRGRAGRRLEPRLRPADHPGARRTGGRGGEPGAGSCADSDRAGPAGDPLRRRRG